MTSNATPLPFKAMHRERDQFRAIAAALKAARGTQPDSDGKITVCIDGLTIRTADIDATIAKYESAARKATPPRAQSIPKWSEADEAHYQVVNGVASTGNNDDLFAEDDPRIKKANRIDYNRQMKRGQRAGESTATLEAEAARGDRSAVDQLAYRQLHNHKAEQEKAMSEKTEAEKATLQRQKAEAVKAMRAEADAIRETENRADAERLERAAANLESMRVKEQEQETENARRAELLAEAEAKAKADAEKHAAKAEKKAKAIAKAKAEKAERAEAVKKAKAAQAATLKAEAQPQSENPVKAPKAEKAEKAPTLADIAEAYNIRKISPQRATMAAIHRNYNINEQSPELDTLAAMHEAYCISEQSAELDTLDQLDRAYNISEPSEPAPVTEIVPLEEQPAARPRRSRAALNAFATVRQLVILVAALIPVLIKIAPTVGKLAVLPITAVLAATKFVGKNWVALLMIAMLATVYVSELPNI